MSHEAKAHIPNPQRLGHDATTNKTNNIEMLYHQIYKYYYIKGDQFNYSELKRH